MATNIATKLKNIASQSMFPNIRKIKQNINSIKSAINSNSSVLNDQSVPLIDSVISKFSSLSNFTSIHSNYTSSLTAIEILAYLNELKQLMLTKRAVGNYLKARKTENSANNMSVINNNSNSNSKSISYNSNSNNTRKSFGPVRSRPQSPRFGGRRKTRRSRR